MNDSIWPKVLVIWAFVMTAILGLSILLATYDIQDAIKRVFGFIETNPLAYGLGFLIVGVVGLYWAFKRYDLL